MFVLRLASFLIYCAVMTVDTSECVMCQRREAHNDKCEYIQRLACSVFRQTGAAQLDSPCQVSESSGLPNRCHVFGIAAALIMRADMNGVTLV